MQLLTIDMKRAVPLYRRIIDGIVKLIDEGTMKRGDALPSTRAFARRIGRLLRTDMKGRGD